MFYRTVLNVIHFKCFGNKYLRYILDCVLLRCNAVLFRRQVPTFRRSLLHPTITIPLKKADVSKQHGVTYQKTFKLTVERISDLTNIRIFLNYWRSTGILSLEGRRVYDIKWRIDRVHAYLFLLIQSLLAYQG